MIRFVSPADTEALLAIYGQYTDTTITFEYVLPSLEEFRNRIETISRDYPYIVYEEDGRILGYAYAHRCWVRAAYQWDAELSIYLDRNACGHGLGSFLCQVLIELLKLQGIRNAFSCVTLPNPASERLQAAMGFTLAGRFINAGYKNGNWQDVGWFQKTILPCDSEPAPLCSISDADQDAVRRILEEANAAQPV